MAINDTAFKFIGVPKGYQRDLAFALDRSSIFYSYNDAVAYASGVAGADSRGLATTSYVGQIIAVLTESAEGDGTIASVGIYKIDADRTLKSLDSAAVDGQSIKLNADGALELYGFADALEGAQPRIALVDGKKIIQWAQPDTTTVDGMNEALDALKETVGDSTKGLVKDNEANKADIAGLREDLGGVAHNVTYDSTTLTITVPMYSADGTGDGDPLVINLPKDNFVRSGRYEQAYVASEGADPIAALILTVDNGDEGDGTTSEIVIPAADLVDVYTGDSTGANGITVTVGADNKISAALKIAAGTVLSLNESGELTIDLSALQTAVDGKLDANKVVDTFEGHTEDDTYVASAKATKAAIDSAASTLDTKITNEATRVDGLVSEIKNTTIPNAISAHNTATDAHTELFAKKQDKVIVVNATLESANWVADGDQYAIEYTLNESVVVPDASCIEIMPATNTNVEAIITAGVLPAIEFDTSTNNIKVFAKKAPTVALDVIIKITPNANFVG